MKRVFATLPLHPFLFAIYPILALYSRNPGEITIPQALRPMLIAALLAGLLLIFLYWNWANKNWLRAAIITSLFGLYLSSSGHAYRILKSTIFPNAGAALHWAIILIGITLVILINTKAVWQRYATTQRIATITTTLNLAAWLSLVYPCFVIGSTVVKGCDDTPPAWTELVGQEDEPQGLAATRRPDIYYIVVDGYARQDVSSGLYGLDNAEFLDYLEARGFYIARDSRSNYVQSPLSFASFLNFDYINFAETQAGSQSINRLPLFDLIRDSRARQLLEAAGYKLVTTSSGYPFTEIIEANVYLAPFDSSASEIERFFLSTTALSALYDTEFPFTPTLRYYLPLPGYETSRQRIQYAFEQLQTIPRLPGAKIVLMHIVAPHPPFIFDRDGNPSEPAQPFSPADGEAFSGGTTEYQRGYIEQLLYINQRLEESIEAILSQSAAPPIIILQADHGPGSMLKRDIVEETCLWERASILNAYYFPDERTDGLYPAITPVNTFRVVFNTYFGTHFDLLPDRTYFSPQSHPYDFTDITDMIQPACQK